ncbi:Cathepsin L-like proteinase [Halotydeus destructor]|nr:Cathepsin L-like proteinase [Halotydeus destructor]
MMKVQSAAAILICLGLAQGFDRDTWDLFKQQHGKKYEAIEDEIRFEVFKQNCHFISDHNVKADLGLISYRLGVNRFADWTKEELDNFKKTQLVYPSHVTEEANYGADDIHHGPRFEEFPFPVPDQFDWRDKDVVSPVAQPQDEGIPAVFAAIGAVESTAAIFHKEVLIPLSTQQVYDCSDRKETTLLPLGVYTYLIHAKGVESAQTYPATRVVGKCKYNETQSEIRVYSLGQLPKGIEEALKVNLAIASPTTVMVDAEHIEFLFYSSGIYSNSKCNSTNVNLAMLAVGYGVDYGTDFWSLKNFWGPTWGENGYMRLARNNDNMCGITTLANSPYVT